MIKFLKEKILKRPIHLNPGDTFTLQYYEPNKSEPTTLLKENISTYQKVDKVGIFEFTEEFGMKQGTGGVFGEKYE